MGLIVEALPEICWGGSPRKALLWRFRKLGPPRRLLHVSSHRSHTAVLCQDPLETLTPHQSLIHSTMWLGLCEALGAQCEGPTVPSGLRWALTGHPTQQGRAGKEGSPDLRREHRGVGRGVLGGGEGKGGWTVLQANSTF